LVTYQREDFRIRLRPRQIGIQLGEHDLRHQQAERACDFAGHELGDQRSGTLACSSELQHVHPIVVRLDDGGQ